MGLLNAEYAHMRSLNNGYTWPTTFDSTCRTLLKCNILKYSHVPNKCERFLIISQYNFVKIHSRQLNSWHSFLTKPLDMMLHRAKKFCDASIRNKILKLQLQWLRDNVLRFYIEGWIPHLSVCTMFVVRGSTGSCGVGFWKSRDAH